MIPVDYNEITRYLGYRGVKPTPEVNARIDTCVKKIHEVIVPRFTYQIFDLTSPKEPVLSFAGISVRSQNLYKNVKGCDRIVMFAATIGIGIDRLIARAELTSMTDAAIYQAAGAAFIESYCDIVNRQINETAARDGYFARPRFSPGYGDLPLAMQTDFARILNMNKTCGISLSETLLMTPSKSVTALIGLSKTNEPCIIQGCEACANAAKCEFCR